MKLHFLILLSFISFVSFGQQNNGLTHVRKSDSLQAFLRYPSDDTLVCDSTVLIPKIFCPNDGCRHDVFQPEFVSRKPIEYELTIYGKKDTIIFHSLNYYEYWNGASNFSVESTYKWMLKCKFSLNDKVHISSGEVLILK